VLGPGEVFGETVFLNKTVEVRSVSARAVEDVELEVWHPGVLRREYDRMSPVLKYITDQMLERLDRMKKLDAGLTHKRRPASLNAQAEPEGESKRRYRRRPLNLGCVYRPEQAPERVLLNGRITDISLGGIGMEVAARNTSSFNHRMNDKLFVLTNLPGGRKLEFAGRIRSFKDEHGPGRVQLGVEFTDLDGEASKALRFFMMS
ncbi:MAG: PilZ domain-containing protein, partial [Desulfobacteraceae bacterium]